MNTKAALPELHRYSCDGAAALTSTCIKYDMVVHVHKFVARA